jgi:hypothetical protein
MIEKATAANRRLLEAFAEGFALDETHAPHISVLQRYVKAAELDKVYEAVGSVLAGEKAASWELKAVADEVLGRLDRDPRKAEVSQTTSKYLYLAHYVPDATGEKFKPHVTIGLARPGYLNKMLEEKFEAFTFSPAKAAIYPAETDRRCRPVHGEHGNRGGVRHDHGRSRHQPADDRLPSRQFRDGAGKSQDVGAGALRPLAPPSAAPRALEGPPMGNGPRSRPGAGTATVRRSPAVRATASALPRSRRLHPRQETWRLGGLGRQYLDAKRPLTRADWERIDNNL